MIRFSVTLARLFLFNKYWLLSKKTTFKLVFFMRIMTLSLKVLASEPNILVKKVTTHLDYSIQPKTFPKLFDSN